MTPAAVRSPTPLPLYALALAAFGIGTSEFVIMGLLPEMAGDLGISIPQAGLLVTAYALGVTFGGPPVAMALARLPRKRALILLLSIFVAGNLGCVLAPTYGLLMAARVLTALSHASFYGIAVVVGAGLVPHNQRSRAIALIMSGLTLANIVGVPIGTFLGQAAGWRAAFAASVALGLIAIAALIAALPARPAESEPTSLRYELSALIRPSALVSLSVSALLSGSLFSVFTYIAPILVDVTGLAPAATGGILLLFGVGCAVGNVIGGRLADRYGFRAVVAIMTALAAILAILAFTMRDQLLAIATVTVWGAACFAAGPGIQTRVLDTAAGAPNLASTVNHSAFNLGNAAGAWIGGLALTLGMGYTGLPWIGALLALVGVGAGLASLRLERRRRPMAP